MAEFNKKSKSNLIGLHPQLVAFAEELLSVSPYYFIITAGVRTAEEQNKLYQQGRTIPGKKVTNCDGYKYKSNHQVKNDGLGYAFDIAIVLGNKLNWDPAKYIELVKSARGLLAKFNIEWGGDWKNFKDYPHFQLKEGKNE
ncbi:hypothetical protein IX317_000071 [Fusobacterium sp. DD29]|uniref:M15 family metallopeptidase n=1 Tax=unclassified Fusobacterium TaxID=2648384 RepID=UPI001B8BFC2F|nr:MULTISPECIES: M15 family metallopeptidase [unclassified Fusobacterium]MBR8701172.1 hypothetical protein [Fusobacterium sp. DD45]MBR8711945.1 hypothetical protein [Fusobacterium sp. DD28]MBR8748414.1 hypothetical protein [Fusobacterium sp. DD29]MBR8752518.1 hypothetical protein [Fusobacterium sp. DD26]MBR8760612.1 hypothetical protein [Fusobacterium sp. DD25]